nr:TetR/AcrR family transcriptional regulator [Chelatococcus reniformis]
MDVETTNTRRAGAAAVEPDEPPQASKRQQILAGARRIFRSRGFDGASMGDIAKAAGVSKGTLYVYFASKEDLFRDLVLEDRRQAAEQIVSLGLDDPDVRGVLRGYGRSIVNMLVEPEHISMVRMVMAAAEKFPQVGRVFYEAGPGYGINRLATYIKAQVEAGRLRTADADLAACHFLELCQGSILKPLFFGVTAQPTPQAIDYTVDAAVDVFLAAYAADGI